MVVIAILAMMATLAFPSFVTQMKKVRSQEGTSALQGLYIAQKNFFHDTGAYTATLTDLEVTIPTMQNFNTPVVYASSTISCNSGPSVQTLASVQDVNAEYTLHVLIDGRIVCTPCSGVCMSMGFPTW